MAPQERMPRAQAHSRSVPFDAGQTEPASAASRPAPVASQTAGRLATPSSLRPGSSPVIPETPYVSTLLPASPAVAPPDPTVVLPTFRPSTGGKGPRCADCGASNAEGARYCGTCGSILPG
jgi:hypothetical protein